MVIRAKQEVTHLELHCFVNSSKTAYGAVIYLCYKDSNGKILEKWWYGRNRIREKILAQFRNCLEDENDEEYEIVIFF